MSIPSAAQIRQQFIDFFVAKCGHTFVPSSPCVPLNDPTLMFTNAGMNQFKSIFLGQQAPDVDKWPGVRPGMATRAANTQKCIRAGGKHNDLDDVGHDTYHHTFFEMLGNWSFGDYFKKEAIEWAWELLTKVWGVDPTRLHATYFQGDAAEGLEPDTEARDLWGKILPPERIHPGNKKDNFWEMGDTGPCGPCSEIHIDLTPDKSGAKLVNAGDARVMEIWNLVFIQFNRGGDGKLSPLPAKHVDTGMGFERITSVLQGNAHNKLGMFSNYDTDVFTPIFAAIQKVTGAAGYTRLLEDTTPDASRKAEVMKDIAYRVIADHIRTLTFALTDGAVPSNEGRGYVLRRILRRAVRYGRQYLLREETISPRPLARPSDFRPDAERTDRMRQTLPASRPFLCDLVPAVVEAMGAAFPELKKNPQRVADLIRDEEASFLKTWDRGIKFFWSAVVEAVFLARHSQALTLVGMGYERYSTMEQTDDLRLVDPEAYSFELTDPTKGGVLHRVRLADLSRDDIQLLCTSVPHIRGQRAFRLHDTFGFPIDLTLLMAEERGLSVDIGEFERLMDESREKARSGGKERVDGFEEPGAEFLAKLSACDDSLKFSDKLSCETTITSCTYLGDKPPAIGCGVSITTLQTCFYAEQGGQVSDIGVVKTKDGEIEIKSVRRYGPVLIHFGMLKQGLVSSHEQPCTLLVDPIRRLTMRNHTATHVMNWVLREVLGDHVQQKGSLVDPDKTRFDLSHHAAISEEELSRIEQLTNEQIAKNLPVHTNDNVPVDQKAAMKIKGLRAVFGEKYPEKVRVVSIGAPVADLLANPDNPEWMKYSIEFCGGTHVKSTGEIGKFRLVEESAVAKGIRRLVGVTGERAQKAEDDATAIMRMLQGASQSSEDALPQRVAEITAAMSQMELPIVERNQLRTDLAHLQERAKKAAKQQAKSGAADIVAKADQLLADAPRVGSTAIIAGDLGVATVDQLRGACDSLRSRAGSAAILLAAENEGKVVLLAAMTADVVGRGVKAGDLIKEIAPIVGGKGGGKPDLAQGGGSDTTKIGEAVTKASQWVTAKL